MCSGLDNYIFHSYPKRTQPSKVNWPKTSKCMYSIHTSPLWLYFSYTDWSVIYTLNKKIIELTRRFYARGAALESPCSMNENSFIEHRTFHFGFPMHHCSTMLLVTQKLSGATLVDSIFIYSKCRKIVLGVNN